MSVKVLIVDDSPVFRETFSNLLNNDPDITVVGIATDADTARKKIADLNPEVITLNLTASKQSNLVFLKEQMPKSPAPVIVITDTAGDTFDATGTGVVGFVKMPLIKTAASMESFAQRLVEQIKSVAKTNTRTAAASAAEPEDKRKAPSLIARFAAKAGIGAAAHSEKNTASVSEKTTAETAAKVSPAVRSAGDSVEPAAAVKPKPDKTEAAPNTKTAAIEAAVRMKLEAAVTSKTANKDTDANSRTVSTATATIPRAIGPMPIPKGRRHVIALGASTGGTDALQVVLQDLPSSTPGIVIVQHMPEMFTKMYADRLDRSCKMKCVEAVDGDRVEPGKIILAAGSYHLRLARDSRGYYVTSKPGEKVSGHCPSVDVLFESVAQVAGKDAVGAIFTGMGADGAKGLKKMRDAGAYTIGQDQHSCVVYGMPMVAYNMGAVCQQAPLDRIPAIILENC